MNTPTWNGGAAEQPKPFDVVAKATTREEEEEAKHKKKVTP